MALFVAAFFFFLLPKALTISFTKETHELLSNTSSKSSQVNQSLEAIYNFVTGVENATTETRVEITTNVGAEETNVDREAAKVLSFYLLKEQVEEAVRKLENKQVLGFSNSAADPLKNYRDLRDLAVGAQHSSKEGEESLVKFSQSIKEQGASAKAANLTETLEEAEKDTETYLSEASKTANYYVTYTDSYVDLASIITEVLTATSLGQVTQSLSDAKKIEQNLKTLEGEDLPAEIDEFHADIVTEVSGAIEFINTYIKLATSEDSDAVSKAIKAARDWISKEQSLALSIQTNQTNFWKKNPSISTYDQLSEKQGELLKKLDSERAKQQFFLLSMLGVK